MFTQKDYTDGKCTTQEFHAQFVDDVVIQVVRVGITERKIKASRDRSFNDIDIREWDLISPAVQRHLKAKCKELGVVMSIAFLVCVEKEAARRIKEGL